MTASRIDGGSNDGDSPGWGDGGGDTGGGSNNGGDDPASQTFQGQHCAINSIKADIANTSDHNSAEHAAIVYHDASGYHTSPTFTGTASQVPMDELKAWMAQNNIAYSQVTDLYHNHDRDFYAPNSTEADINRYPSSSAYDPRGRDWDAADDFVSRGADPSVFTMTIEDTDGVARDFKYSQESFYKNMNPMQMADGVGLPPADATCHDD